MVWGSVWFGLFFVSLLFLCVCCVVVSSCFPVAWLLFLGEFYFFEPHGVFVCVFVWNYES